MTQVILNANYTLTAKIYDTAGELVKSSKTGLAGANNVSVDLSGLSSGLYFAVVDLVTPQGAKAGEQVTQLVIQR